MGLCWMWNSKIAMRRLVEPELLDQLPVTDPEAVRSRRDLSRLNAVMGHLGILYRALTVTDPVPALRRLVEWGAGDGTFLLRLARRLAPRFRNVRVLLVDRQRVVAPETLSAFGELSWEAEAMVADLLDGSGPVWSEPADLILANLFLHHFEDAALAELLRRAAQQTLYFLACEPRRGPRALAASRLVWLMGCNSVTCHDALASVRAGLAGRELSQLWPVTSGWALREFPAGWFSHCFLARR